MAGWEARRRPGGLLSRRVVGSSCARPFGYRLRYTDLRRERDPVSQNACQSSAPPRLALCNRGNAAQGDVDGVWWPNTSDLKTELPDLVVVCGSWIGQVRRVVYDPSMWSPTPSRIIRGNTAIPVDPYHLVARDTIYLVGTHCRDAVLFVVPPTSSDETVRRVLSTVSGSSQPMSVALLRQLVRKLAPDAGWFAQSAP